jgi:hypothetical protein
MRKVSLVKVEEVFRAGWEATGEGHNAEWPDEGVPWRESAGYRAYLEWLTKHEPASSGPTETVA